jgi:DNA-binding transcriptional regulator GbsR (MarR family)
LDEIGKLPDGQALKISFSKIKDVPVANLRSSIGRATKTRGIKIATYSDADDFYVWKRTSKTSSFERNVKRPKTDR